MKQHFQIRAAFTLIELLIVIAIIAVLALIVLLVINPAELLKQSRDSGRLSDLSTLRSAIQSYQADVPTASLGSSTITYLSLIDPSATTSIGTDCTSLGLPPATYHCAASSSARAVDGTGWLPLNLQSISSRSPLASLPIDPINTTSSNLFYTYATDGTTWKISSFPESQKYQTQLTTGASSFQSGTNLFLNSPVPGLVGWWKFDEGGGTTAADSSGYGNTGGWNGTAVGTSGYYSKGKVGNFAGTFDGSTDYVDVGTLKPLQITISLWLNESSLQTQGCNIVSRGNLNFGSGYFFEVSGGNISWLASYGGGGYQYDQVTTSGQSTNSWNHLVAIASASNMQLYVNGRLVASGPRTNLLGYLSGDTNTMIMSSLSYAPTLINGSWQPCFGLVDDVRIYNRALSAAEIQRIYLGTE